MTRIRKKLLGFLFLWLIVTLNLHAQDQSFEMTQIGPNNLLDKPWALIYGPDDYLWITEREAGTVVRVNPATGEKEELLKISDVYASSGQDGLLGMTLHPQFTQDSTYVYLSYTHLVAGERKQRIVRYFYDNNGSEGTLSTPIVLMDNLPASNDHNSGRLIFGPDEKLYYSIGDQGGNQNANFCRPILSQVLPDQEAIDQQDWSHYPGKILRINPDGSIPMDNPVLEGVQSHIYSYGYRNPQGLVFGSNGLLYSDEHGPNTDDEINIIYTGNNYGWPNVVGFQDDQAYDYCDWSVAPNCTNLNYSNGSCPETVTPLEESTFVTTNYQEPLFSMFAVPDDYNYNNPACANAWICRPNVAPSSLAIYEGDAIPDWNNSLLVTSLKRGRILRLKLDEAGTTVVGDTVEHFYTQNRYRDIVVAPNGESIYVITDQTGRTSGPSGFTVTNNLRNPGSLLQFTVQDLVSTSNQQVAPHFKVWPNPTSKRLFIEFEELPKGNVRAVLIKITGEVMLQIDGLRSKITEMHTEGLAPGLYMLRLYSDTYTMEQRVVLF